MVELVDDRDDRLLVPPGIARLNFRSDLEPVLGVEEHHAHVGHPERREQSAAKVVRARRVDDVQLAPHVLGEQDRRIDRAFIKVLHVSVLSFSTLPRRSITPPSKAIASASVVLPEPEAPSRTTFLMSCVVYVFIIR